jgi:tetratricopeptide (TPR) repeat protein
VRYDKVKAPAMSNAANPTVLSESSTPLDGIDALRRKRLQIAAVRVSPGPYLASSILLLFISIWLFRNHSDLAALLLVVVSLAVVPVLSMFEKIGFDGYEVYRYGPVSLITGRFSSNFRLKIDDIERIESSALRTLRSGGRVHYRYRSEISGLGRSFVISSGGLSYRRMVRELFGRISEDKLDLRSMELRDYLCEPTTLRASLSMLNFAPVSVLDSAAVPSLIRNARHAGIVTNQTERPDEDMRARALALRLVANQLRVNGRLREAAEAFRRASPSLKEDGGLSLEIARYIRSLAGVSRDSSLIRRSIAALRLAAKRAGDNPGLLLRIGETFLEAGEVAKARAQFEKVLCIDERSFRASLGLADIALREGKLAHVIHHYDSAARETFDKALKAFSQRESSYFRRLNFDDEYLDAELSRISWLQNSEQLRKISLRLVTAGLIVALVGPAIDDKLAGVGWTVSLIATAGWMIALGGRKWFSHRRALGQTGVLE